MSKIGNKIVQIRKRGGLSKIAVDKGGSELQVRLYHQDHKDPNAQGTLLGEYKGKTILDTKQFISPIWSDLKKQWSWGGSVEDLARIIKAMKLRNADGVVITPGQNVADRLIHRQDEVFNHKDLYARYFMENGRISLNLSDPLQEFLYYCYKGDHLVKDNAESGPVSKFMSAGTKFELVSPKAESQKKKVDAKKEVLAIGYLAKLDGNEDKIRAICEIMDLPGYGPGTDINGAWLLLKDVAAQNTAVSSKYGKSYQDRFIELCEMKDEDLNIHHQVVEGKNKGIIRRKRGYYLFNGERLEGLTSDTMLMNYFRDPKNQEAYLQLDDLLKEDANKH